MRAFLHPFPRRSLHPFSCFRYSGPTRSNTNIARDGIQLTQSAKARGGQHADSTIASRDLRGSPGADLPKLKEPERASGHAKKIQASKSQLLEARCLFRSILRECSYLPDPYARLWVVQYVKRRFRSQEWRPPGAESPLKKARSGLFRLRRASQGIQKPLLHVLLMAYGRKGRRRRELVQQLLDEGKLVGIHDAVQNPDTTTVIDQREAFPIAGGDREVSRQVNTTKTTNVSATAFTPPLSSQMQALVESQMHVAPPRLTRSNPRSLEPVVPEWNSWGAPTPLARVKNIHKNHYAKLLNRVLPPSPPDEWYRLRDLANGIIKPTGSIPRRKGLRRVTPLELSARFGKVDKKFLRKNDFRPLSSRHMRRLYTEVFRQCPLMEWDAARERWKITWGGAALDSRMGTDDRIGKSVGTGADNEEQGEETARSAFKWKRARKQPDETTTSSRPPSPRPTGRPTSTASPDLRKRPLLHVAGR